MRRLLILLLTLPFYSCASGFACLLEQGSRPVQKAATRPHESVGITPIQLSFDRENQLFDHERTVLGLRLGLLSSDNHRVHGFDFNIGKAISGGGSGVATSLLTNWVTHDFSGIQIATVINDMEGPKGSKANPTRMTGLQVALVANNSAQLRGIQVAAVNMSGTGFGVQLGGGNAAGSLFGLQAGLYNLANDVHGLQIAPANNASDIHGAQIGLLNRAKSGLQIGLLNFNESGFLPVFPFVNF